MKIEYQIVFFLGMMSGGFIASIFLILFMINRES